MTLEHKANKIHNLSCNKKGCKMSNTKFINLTKLANQAKSVGEYRIANWIFAYLLEEYFRLPEDEKNGTEDGPPPLWLEWETSDEYGEYPPEVYYDLLVIVCPESFENGYLLHHLNIPVPLLNHFSALTALKCAAVVDREEHGREIREPSETEIADLWSRLFEMVDHSTLASVASSNLDLEESGLPVAPINWGVNGGDGSVNMELLLDR